MEKQMNENIKTNNIYSCGRLLEVYFEIKTVYGNLVDGYYKPMTLENMASYYTTDAEWDVIDFCKPITLNTVEFVVDDIKWYVETSRIEETLEKIRTNWLIND